MNKRLSILLILSLSLASVTTVNATGISDIQRQKQQTEQELDKANSRLSGLQSQQDEIESEINELDRQLVEVMTSVSLLEDEIEKSKEDITAANLKHTEAKSREDEQYEAMKIRIRLLYEKGDTGYLDLLLGAKNFSDMVNKADYVEQIYSYDRKMLQQYQEVRKEVEELKEKLETKKSELEASQFELEGEKESLEGLLTEKQVQSDDYDGQIARVKQDAVAYKAKIKQQNTQIRQIQAAEEARRKAEEEAKRKAEEDARKKAAEEEALRKQTDSLTQADKESLQKPTDSEGGESAQKASSADGQAASESGGKKEQSAGGDKNYQMPSGSASGSRVVDFAKQFVGNPYVAGGTSLTNGADCSGFTQSVYKSFGISIPRTSTAQRNAGYGVDYSEVQPGDLICYAGHVAIYIGGGQIVHASTVKTGIKISNAAYREILTVRRVVG